MTASTREEIIAQAATLNGYDSAQLARLAGDLPIILRPVYGTRGYVMKAFITVDGATLPLAKHADQAWAADMPTLRPTPTPSAGQEYIRRRYQGPAKRQAS